MNLHYTHIALISFITASISIVIAFVSWRRRSTPGAFAVMLLMLAIAEWTLARTFEALAVEMSFKVMWAKFEYLGILSFPVFWLLFTLQYTRTWNKVVTKRNISFLFIIPLITLILVFTNEWHGLIWCDIVPSPGREADVLIYDHGAWLWVAAAQNYLLVLVGTLILLQSSISHFSLYKMQSLAIFTAIAIPWIGNAVYLMGYSPVPGLDLTPIAFMLTGVIIGWSVFRYRFLDLVPVARNTLFEALSDGVVVLDTQDRIVDFNSKARRYFKPDNKSAIGEKAEKVIPALFRDLQFEHNEIDLNDTIQINDDSQSRWIDMRVSPLTDQQDRLKGRLVVLRDITKSQQTLNSLKESEEKISAIFRTSPIGICLVIDQKIEWANETMYTMVGHEGESIIGQSANIFYEDHEDYERVAHQLDAEIFQFGFGQVETQLLTKGGGSLDCIIRASNFSPSDPSKGQILVINDVSEINRLRMQLERARKMEALGTLAGGVAHDLNNMLSGIVGYPDLILMQLPEDDPLIKLIIAIQESGLKAASIVQDLLTLARRGVTTTEVVNFNTIISEYLNSPEYKKLLSFHPKVELKTEFEPDLLNILGSPVHLAKTVMNLVSNAAESMSDGGTIWISTENKYIDRPINGYDDIIEGDYVILTVTDNGSGISSEDKERIFEPFYTKKAMGRSGTGLGMAVVWGTVKDHNGYIDVKSNEGHGSAFTLYLPITREALPEACPALHVKDYRGSGELVLVVDDIADQREIAVTLLNELGYTTIAVSGGLEAVEYMKNNTADLLVLDMIMDPGIDGLDTYKKILEIRPGQKAIIASGFSETNRVREAQSLGAGQYIRKPYTLEKIGVAVRAELDR